MFRHLSAVWTARHFLLALVKLDLRLRYRRSVLGVGWSLLHPVAMTEVVVGPWPFRGESLELTASGRRVPAVPYPSADALAAAGSVPVNLKWRLVQGEVGSFVIRDS